MKQKSWIILLFFYLLITSCEDTHYTAPPSSENLVTASIQFSVDDVLSGFSREIVDHIDNLVSNDTTSAPVITRNAPQTVLHRRAVIYQFSGNGDLYYKSEPFSIDLSYGVPSAIETKLRQGTNMTVALFVASNDSQLPDIRSENEIQDLRTTYDTVHTDDAMPFFSIQYNVDIYTDTQHTLNKFTLERLCSKLIVEYEIDKGSGFYLQEIRIANIPASTYYHPREQHVETKFISTSWSVSASGGSFTCYIPENKQGRVNSIQVPEHKNIRNAPLNATYIELTGFYKNKKVTFRIFPGANATNDFNLSRNHWYRITLRITDVYLEDLRVDAYDSEKFVIYIGDEPTRDYSEIKNILLNNQLWINDFTIDGARITMNYTSTPGSVLSDIRFCDQSGNEIFGGQVNYTFAQYSHMNFSSLLQAQGSGAPSDPYLIFTPLQLKYISRICNAGYKSRRFVQQNDIDLFYFDVNKWEPIGSDHQPFRGLYDGNGFSVENLTINTERAGDNSKIIPRAGLFGKVKDAVIRNLHIREGYIGCKSASMGAIAASVENSRIVECSSTLKIEQFQRANVGGIAGELINSELSDCYNACPKEMTAWKSATYYTGGITGYMQNSRISNVYSVQAIWIDNRYALGAVVGALVDGSVTENIFGEEYKTSGNKIIGNPASTNGLMSSSYLKSAAFVQKLNNGSESGAWKYRSGNYPKLKGER